MTAVTEAPGLVQPPDDTATRQAGLRGINWMTALFIACYVALGMVIGTMRGEGLGFGDTRTAPAVIPDAVDSLVGSAWRIAGSLAVLGLLPVIWFAFLSRLGAFGRGADEEPLPTELDELTSLDRDEARFAGAHRLAQSFSAFCLVVLLVFGNFFLPYVLIRWGWGPVR